MIVFSNVLYDLPVYFIFLFFSFLRGWFGNKWSWIEQTKNDRRQREREKESDIYSEQNLCAYAQTTNKTCKLYTYNIWVDISWSEYNHKHNAADVTVYIEFMNGWAESVQHRNIDSHSLPISPDTVITLQINDQIDIIQWTALTLVSAHVSCHIILIETTEWLSFSTYYRYTKTHTFQPTFSISDENRKRIWWISIIAANSNFPPIILLVRQQETTRSLSALYTSYIYYDAKSACAYANLRFVLKLHLCDVHISGGTRMSMCI